MNRLVLEAKEKAIKAGVKFSDSYPPPYSVHVISIITKNALDFDLPDHYFRRDKNGCVTHYEEDILKLKRATELYYVKFHNHNRFGPFYLTKSEAESFADIYNIRHFNVAAMSFNPNYPVLI